MGDTASSSGSPQMPGRVLGKEGDGTADGLRPSQMDHDPTGHGAPPHGSGAWIRPLDSAEHTFVSSPALMDIGKQQRIIQVEPEPLTVPPNEEPAQEEPPVEHPEPVPSRR